MVSDSLGDYAAYFFYRRMLSYFMELRKQKEYRAAANRIADMMCSEKKEVLRVYQEQFQSKGDTIRMKLFLMSPDMYYGINRLYERVILPLRR